MELISMKDAIEICDQTFEGFGLGTTINPSKVTLDLGERAPYPPYEGFMNSMPAYVGFLDVAGMKFVGGFLGERKKLGLPYLTGLILVIDPHTGKFTGIVEGAHITNLRTGAQTAIALKYLRPSGTIRLGIYGAGMQGRMQVQAISEVFEIERLTVYDINPKAAHSFKEDIEGCVKGEVIIASSPETAADADAVITVTQAKNKFLKDDWVKAGTIVFPMGSYQECEDSLILNSDKIVVDHLEQALHRGALRELHQKGLITEENIHATLGDLAAGKTRIDNEDERLLCILIGTGALDVAIAHVALNRAKEKGLGTGFAFV